MDGWIDGIKRTLAPPQGQVIDDVRARVNKRVQHVEHLDFKRIVASSAPGQGNTGNGVVFYGAKRSSHNIPF